MRDLWFDLKIAIRSLSASRMTTIAAVVVLALGTGINTAVLAVAYGILVRPLPYRDACQGGRDHAPRTRAALTSACPARSSTSGSAG